MSDHKPPYSNESKAYVQGPAKTVGIDAARFVRSVLRELEFNAKWSQQKVNINDIVDRFIVAIDGAVLKQYTEGGIKW